MNRALLLAVLVGSAAVAGCGPPAAPTAARQGTITWEQFRKLPAEDQADPYVLNNLDDDARKKFDEQARKHKR